MKGKKGMEASALVRLIGIIASFIVVAILFKNIFDLAYGETAENVCRLSVISHAKTQVAGSPVMNLKCPRKFITFDNEGYKIHYADDLPIDKEKLSYKKKFDDEPSKKHQIYEIFADEMAECWYKMGEGELDVFSEGWLTRHPCMVCAQIDFSDDFDRIDLGNVGDFTHYLEHNNFTKYAKNEKYKEFLFDMYDSSFSINHLAYYVEEDRIKILSDKNSGFDLNTPYLIYFKAYKFDKTHKFFTWAGETLPGEKLNKLFPNDRYFVFFSEQKDVPLACNMVVN